MLDITLRVNLARMTQKITTPAGLKKYKDDLAHLKNVKKKEIAEDIQEAKEQGDLSENAAYSAAKDEMEHVERRIDELEQILKNVKVVSKEKNRDKVVIGSQVKVTSQNQEAEFEIVGSNESDPANGKISNESAVGEALLGKSNGDKVLVNTPSGKVEYNILSIR